MPEFQDILVKVCENYAPDDICIQVSARPEGVQTTGRLPYLEPIPKDVLDSSQQKEQVYRAYCPGFTGDRVPCVACTMRGHEMIVDGNGLRHRDLENILL
jgi:hypothetical protein